eukprot:scaffold3731_cov63-Phaeocystis_antarctica.AAC.2
MSSLHDASRDGDTERVKQLLDSGAPVDEKDKYGNTALIGASQCGHTEVVKLLLDKGASVDEKNKDGCTALWWASENGRTEVVKLLLDKGASVDEKDSTHGSTPLMSASWNGRTEVVKLLLDKGALLDERTKGIRFLTPLLGASNQGHTEVAQLLLDKRASLDKEDKDGRTALMLASNNGHTEVLQLLLDKGAPLNEKDKRGSTVLMIASYNGHTEVVKLLLDKGALLDGKAKDCDTALLSVVAFDEDQLGRMAAAQVHGHSPQGQVGDPAATAKAVLQVVRFAGFARARARTLRSSDPRCADDHQALFRRLQLAAAACVQNDEYGKARGKKDVQRLFRSVDGRKALEQAVQIEAKQLLEQPVVQGYMQVAWRGDLVGLVVGSSIYKYWRFARLQYLQILAPVSTNTGDIQVARLWDGSRVTVDRFEARQVGNHVTIHRDGGDRVGDTLTVEGNTLSGSDKNKLIRPVGTVESNGDIVWEHGHTSYKQSSAGTPGTTNQDLSGTYHSAANPSSNLPWVVVCIALLLNLLLLLPLVALVPALESWLTTKLGGNDGVYLLRLPFIKFGLECAADLTLALALTFISTANLTTAPVAPLLLFWVGSGLLWEGRQVMAFSSNEPTPLGRLRERFAAYRADYINIFDATALVFSFAALVAFLSSTYDNAIATALRVVAVFLLWFRLFRVPLLNSFLGPYVMMYFKMLFGDLRNFLVLLLFLLLAFGASWTVLLEPQSSALIAGCADDLDLGGVDFPSTLLRLLEGALTGNDRFECARNSTTSPAFAWVISITYVTLTAVLLLNMLIAMCAAATTLSAIA